MPLLRRHRGIALAALLLLIILPAGEKARAHKAAIFAYVVGDTVHTESYFQDGKRVVNGEVEVFDGAGNRLTGGATDENGEFSFAVPRTEEVVVKLNTSTGHSASFRLPMEKGSLPDEESGPVGVEGSSEAKGDRGEDRSGSQDYPGKPGEGWGPVGSEASPLSQEDLRRVVDQELARYLKPIAREIAMLTEERRVSITEIVGGIGYIVGLMGLVLYLRSRGR